MFEKLKDIFYDISDYVVTIIIVFFIVISIGFIMTKSYGLEFSKNDLLSFFQKGSNTEVVLETPEAEKETPKPDTTTPSTTSPETSTPETSTPGTTAVETPAETAAEPDKDAGQEVVVGIYEGDGAYDIGGRLVDNGVIKDSQEFVNELVNRGLDTSVRVGEYTFKKGMTMDEVFSVLFD